MEINGNNVKTSPLPDLREDWETTASDEPHCPTHALQVEIRRVDATRLVNGVGGSLVWLAIAISAVAEIGAIVVTFSEAIKRQTQGSSGEGVVCLPLV